MKIKQLQTKIPGWYDIDFLESGGAVPEPGAYIRSRVQVSSKKITQQIKDEEERIRGLFPKTKNLRLFVIPQIQQTKKLEVNLTGETDEDIVAQYVAATYQDSVRFTAEGAVAYIGQKLKRIAPSARGSLLRFLYTVGRGVLSFKKVKVSYSRLGLVLLRGKNLDWPKRSNGAGKTNALSLLPLALFGETLKGQKNDAWINEKMEDDAYIKLVLRSDRGKKVEIERARPHRIQMWVDGQDESSGLTGKRKNETQGQIEDVTGFDMRMLLNSVYIDQTIANGFVFGTQKSRMDLIGKIQDLARFDAALELVKSDMKQYAKQSDEIDNTIHEYEDDLNDLSLQMDDLAYVVESAEHWKKKGQAALKYVRRCQQKKAELASHEKFFKTMTDEADQLVQELAGLRISANDASVVVDGARKELHRAESLIEKGRCPTCTQESLDVGRAIAKKASSALASGKATLAKISEIVLSKEARAAKLIQKLNDHTERTNWADSELNTARAQLKTIQEGETLETKRNQKAAEKRKSLKQKRLKVKSLLRASTQRRKDLIGDMERIEYAAKALHRSGIPLYLAASLCPVLNRAADEYSNIFINGAIKLNFEVNDSDFDVSILNTAGSASSDGQSVGERAMAGIICAFALREVAPKTNLLILDEPGHGLDSEGARQFAKGLIRLKDQYESIIVTTHSPVIEGLLEGEATVWTVKKKNGISRLIVPE